MKTSQNITPFLWFNDNAEEAIQHYCSIFKGSKVLSTSRYGEGGPFPKGTLMSATFELDGLRLMALNAGPHHQFNDAISLYVERETQGELDALWEKLLEGGGRPTQCGWLKDRFGLSWQVIPSVLPKLLGDPDPAKAGRAVQAMLSMTRLDIAELERAHAGA